MGKGSRRHYYRNVYSRRNHGKFTSASATASAPASLTFNSSYYGFYQSCADYAGDCDVFIYAQPGFPALGLVCACSSFVGHEGGTLGSTSDPANGWDSDIDYSNTNLDLFTSGSLTPTPEPSGLLLMGSGFVAFAGMVRRRLKA